MKTSIRHRWVPHPAKDWELCRDCGMEVASYRIKGGGLGECIGKACERQDRLSLISGDPQGVDTAGEQRPLVMGCVGCGMGIETTLHHRNPAGRVTGLLFSCNRCAGYLRDHAVVFVAKDE